MLDMTEQVHAYQQQRERGEGAWGRCGSSSALSPPPVGMRTSNTYKRDCTLPGELFASREQFLPTADSLHYRLLQST